MNRSRWVGILSVLALVAAGALLLLPSERSPFASLAAAEVPASLPLDEAAAAQPSAVTAEPYGSVADERAKPRKHRTAHKAAHPREGRPASRARKAREEGPDAATRDRELAALVERVQSESTEPQPVSFTLASFNVLGSQHTAPGGQKRGYAPGRVRAEWAARIVGAQGLDIVGWSELQGDQYATLAGATGGRYDFWPGTALGGAGVPASLMWRTDRFTAVEKHSVLIPFLGQQRPMPIVRLRESATGREFYVMNVHNAPGRREWERDRAEQLELGAIRSLREQTKLPVFLTGDMNEHGEIFCNVRRATDLLAANGGSMDGGCRPPGGRPRLDWVFGSPEATFTGYLADKGPQIQRITDHAVIFTSVTLG